MFPFLSFFVALCIVLFGFSAPGVAESLSAVSNEGDSSVPLDALLHHPASYAAFCLFIVAYIMVLIEHKTMLKKSKPMMIGAALIWSLVSWVVHDVGMDVEDLRDALGETLSDYAGLMLFLLSAMAFISALEERQVFDCLRSKMVDTGLGYRSLFWATGAATFFLSPLADNMTSALVMGTVAVALVRDNPKLLTMFMVNIVSAANAGGVFSPFGDITTLMVWQAGKLGFFDFFVLFLPALTAFAVPALIMHFFIPAGTKPDATSVSIPMKTGAKRIIGLGLFTILLAVSFEHFLELPSFLGMMLGLGLLLTAITAIENRSDDRQDDFDAFSLMHKTEWDTILFFFGVIFCISGLAYLGALDVFSSALYGSGEAFGLGVEKANIIIGALSAVIDNIPLMYAVLQMSPDLSSFGWTELTLCLGLGGSLLSLGSPAGVVLTGVAKDSYNFMSHLKWTPVLLVGYLSSIAVHHWLNG